MIKSNNSHKISTHNSNYNNNYRYKRLVSIGRRSKGIINDLYNPIDAANRFINLALDGTGEDSQARQFLLESKHGIRRTTDLLKQLSDYAEKMEKEINGILLANE